MPIILVFIDIQIDSLMQKRCNSSVLAMELCLVCIKPPKYWQSYMQIFYSFLFMIHVSKIYPQITHLLQMVSQCDGTDSWVQVTWLVAKDHMNRSRFLKLGLKKINKTRYVDGTPTSEVTPVTILYIRPPTMVTLVNIMVINGWFPSFSFHVNQPSHSWDKAISDSDLEISTPRSRSRSWVWSKDKVI